MMFEALIDRLVAHYTGPQFRDEVVQAKRDFFEDAGLIGDDTNQFEVRMAQFLDWYIFSRDLSETHLPPVHLAFETAPFDMTDLERAQLRALTEHKHSLFEHVRTLRQDVSIRDLFNGQKYTIENTNVTHGFNADEVFETRIFPWEGTWGFARGFCFHPVEASAFIREECKKIRHLEAHDKEVLMLRLMKMRYKHDQYQHIRLDYIYTNEPKLRF